MKSKYSDIYAMMSRLVSDYTDPEVKESLVYGASEGRTIHLHELTDLELGRLRAGLKRLLKQPLPLPDAPNAAKNQHIYEPRGGLKSRRRAVLALLTKYGINTRDWDAINAFVRDKRIAGKEFAELTSDELTALSKKLHAILKKKGITLYSSKQQAAAPEKEQQQPEPEQPQPEEETAATAPAAGKSRKRARPAFKQPEYVATFRVTINGELFI